MASYFEFCQTKWDLSDNEAHQLLLNAYDANQEGSVPEEIAFAHSHFIFVIDLSPSVFSVAADGDYIVCDALISSLFSVLRQLLSISQQWNESDDEKAKHRAIRISVIGFSTVHTPNCRQAFLLCTPLTDEVFSNLQGKINDYVRLLVQLYEPIAKNWIIGDSDDQVLLIPGLFESDVSDEENDFTTEDRNDEIRKPTLELGTSDIAMIDQMHIAYRIAQLTVGKLRTVAIFVTDGVTDLPTPTITDYLISRFRCTGIPCSFLLASSSDLNRCKRDGLAPASYFAHIVNKALLEVISCATNGILCFTKFKGGSFDVDKNFVHHLLHERIPCFCHAFNSSSPVPNLATYNFRKTTISVLVYPIVSARFAHGFKMCRGVPPEPSGFNMCLRWHPRVTIRYLISPISLDVSLEGDTGILQSVYAKEALDNGSIANIDERPRMRQTMSSQIGNDLFRYLNRLAAIDDLIGTIYNTTNAVLPDDPVLHEVPLFVFVPKDRQLVVNESLRQREAGGNSEGGDVEDASAFIAYWKNVATLNVATMKLIFLTRSMQYFLNYDHPLPKVLLTASSPGILPASRQASALGCRLALNNLVTFLRTNWASFELIENRAFVRFCEEPRFCIVRISDRLLPIVTINVSFLRGTETRMIHQVLEELSEQFENNVLQSAKQQEITTMFPLYLPVESFLVEPSAWLESLDSFGGSVPDQRTLLAAIEHSQPARLRQMKNAALLSRIYRASRLVFELVLPSGMAPRGLFSRLLRHFIKQRLASGFQFSSASNAYLCFGLEVPPEDSNSFLRPFLQTNLSFSVEECPIAPPSNSSQIDTSTSITGASPKPSEDGDKTSSRGHSHSTMQPPRRLSLAVGVSPTESLLFRIISESWVLPVGVCDTTGLGRVVVETHRQDFELIRLLYTFFVFRLVGIIAGSNDILLEKSPGTFQLPSSSKWRWNPPEFSENGPRRMSVLDSLNHPVFTLIGHPDLFSLLSCSQEVIIRMPLLRCGSGDKSISDQAASILRDLTTQSLSSRFVYSTGVTGSSKTPKDPNFIGNHCVDPRDNMEWTMLMKTSDRPEHITMLFIPTGLSAWTDEELKFVSVYMYIISFDWLSDSKSKPDDLSFDMTADVFVSNKDEPKTPTKHRFNSDPNAEESWNLETATFIGAIQGERLADACAAIYVAAVFKCLHRQLPICSSDFELAVSSLCTESVCSEVDLRPLLSLHGSICPEGGTCSTPMSPDRLGSILTQWFQPVPCAPNYFFFRSADLNLDDSDPASEGNINVSISDSSSVGWTDIRSESSFSSSSERRESDDSDDSTASLDSNNVGAMPSPPLFLHCTCSVMVRSSNSSQPPSLIHIPISTLPFCLRALLENAEELDESLPPDAASLLDAVNSVTLDVICIAPNPVKVPVSVPSTPVHKSAMTHPWRSARRRASSILAKEEASLSYFKTLSLHPVQDQAITALVKQLHWLVQDSTLMAASSSDVDLAALAGHVVDTLRIARLSCPNPPDPDFLPPFCPLVKKKRLNLTFVFGEEQSRGDFVDLFSEWKLHDNSAVVTRLGASSYFYCAQSIETDDTLHQNVFNTAISYSSASEEHEKATEEGLQFLGTVSEHDLSQKQAFSISKPTSSSSQMLLLPHFRRRHQSAAPVVPLRASLMFAGSRQLSSSRRQIDTTSPPLSLGIPIISPEKSSAEVGNDETLSSASSTQSIFTGGGYESDTEMTNRDYKDIEDAEPIAPSPVGIDNSQQAWVFCKVRRKVCKFFLYVPWQCRLTSQREPSLLFLKEFIDAAEQCVKRTNQLLLLKDMHLNLLANQLMLHVDDAESGVRSYPDVQSATKLAEELTFPLEYFECPIQATYRFYLHPSFRAGTTAIMIHGRGRPNLPTAGISESSSSAATPAGRALAVFRGFLRNVAVLNRTDVFTYRQSREAPLPDLLFYLVFTSGHATPSLGADGGDKSDAEPVPAVASSVLPDVQLGSSVIHRDSTVPLAASLSRSNSRLLNTAPSSSPAGPPTPMISQQPSWWIDLHVHGLEPPISQEFNNLVQGLHNALNKAILQNLLTSLLKNPMHRLTPSDVDFIQHSPTPLYFYYALPSQCCSSPASWFVYFKQTFLSGYAHHPHFSAAAGDSTRFKDTVQTPPGVLDNSNTFIFFTRIESALSGIACVNVSLIPPFEERLENTETSESFSDVLASKSPNQIVNEQLKGYQKLDSPSTVEWTFQVRVWERGTVQPELELAIERCISAAAGDALTEELLASMIPESPAQPFQWTGEEGACAVSWLRLSGFLEEVASQFSPPSTITTKKFTIPLMRISLWLEFASRSLSPPKSPSQPCCAYLLWSPKESSKDEAGRRRFSRLDIKELSSVANSHRKLSDSQWLLFSTQLPADWRKHSGTPARQSFAVIYLLPVSTLQCSASLLLYNVVSQRCDHLISELETTSKLGDFQTKCGTDVVLQKAGLFSLQHVVAERPQTTVLEMASVLSGKPEIVKQVSKRNIPNPHKSDPWLINIYARLAFRDQLALSTKRNLSTNPSQVDKISESFLEFSRQIVTSAESIHRRREAVFFASKIVQSLDYPADESPVTALLQQQQQRNLQPMNTYSTQNSRESNVRTVAGPSPIISGKKSKSSKRILWHRLQSIRSSSLSTVTLDSGAVNILRHSCRLQHFVSAPLVLSPLWRDLAIARASSAVSPSNDSKNLPPLPVNELGLYTWFRDEYLAYIQRSLFLFELAVVSTGAQQHGTSNSHKIHSGSMHPQHTQPLFSFLSSSGGLLLFQCDLRGIDLHLRLYTWERYRASTSAASRFAELVDRCRTMTHLHSFCYDQHVRIVQSWILDESSVLPPQYDHAAIMRGLCSVYHRTPMYAASLLSSGTTDISGLRFMTARELIDRLHAGNYERPEDAPFDLKVREFQFVSDDDSGGILVPELTLAGKDRTGVSKGISTTLTATIRPVVFKTEEGFQVSESDVKILFAVATTTKRWKELFPLRTRSLRIDEIEGQKGAKIVGIYSELRDLALAVPKYIQRGVNGQNEVSALAASCLRTLCLSCYQQGLADSQWRRITSAADVLSQASPNRHEMLTCGDLRALTMDAAASAPGRHTPETLPLISVEQVTVSMGCQALPLAVVDSRLARLRLARPSQALARALKYRFPLTVWLPGPPNESVPEFTLIIAQDRQCAVVIAWPMPELQKALSSSSSSLTPNTSAKQIEAPSSPIIASGTSGVSASRRTTALEPAQLFFLSRHPSRQQTPAVYDSSKPGSPSELPFHHSYSLFCNPAHRVFTESIIGCLTADFIRHVLDRATPGKS